MSPLTLTLCVHFCCHPPTPPTPTPTPPCDFRSHKQQNLSKKQQEGPRLGLLRRLGSVEKLKVVSTRENASSCSSGSMLPNTDSEISLLSCHLKSRLLSPAASTICQPLCRSQLLMNALWLVLYPKGPNSKAASHYFECDINGINILTPHLPRVGNLESQVRLVIELWSDVIDR